ncbi:MAG: hypothetical protein C4317_00445 [Acidimicrobiia bacterium]
MGEREEAVIPINPLRGCTDPLAHGGSSCRYLPLTRTLKGSSGRVARPAVVSYHLGWHGVAEPERREKALRASGTRMPLN